MLNSVLLEGFVVDTPVKDGKTSTVFHLEAPDKEEVNIFEIRAQGKTAQSQAAQLSKGQTCRIVGRARQTANKAWFVAEVIELKPL